MGLESGPLWRPRTPFITVHRACLRLPVRCVFLHSLDDVNSSANTDVKERALMLKKEELGEILLCSDGINLEGGGNL